MFRTKLRRERGVGMVELMIALLIGTMLIIGAVTVYLQSRSAYIVNESMSRVQENARFALAILEPDVRLANFWGLNNRTAFVQARRDQPDELNDIAGNCSERWHIDLTDEIGAAPAAGVVEDALEAFNNANPYAGTCLSPADYADGSDVLIVRHASEQVTAVTAGRVQVVSNRLSTRLFDGGAGLPAGFGALSEVRDLVARAYYIRPWAFTPGDGIPSLRRKELGPGPGIADEEVIVGVEDLQVQFGVDTNDDGTVDRYVSPDNPILDINDAAFVPGIDVVALRVFLLMRSERSEPNVVDTATYRYADREFTANDGFRRLLVTKTIQLRNRRA